MDLYRPVLEKLLSPAVEAARGRSVASLRQFLRGSEHWPVDALRDMQDGLLRRLIRHAAAHTPYYRARLADLGIAPEDIATVVDLRRLPLLDRDRARDTLEARTAATPAWLVETAAHVPGGPPVAIRYGAEAQQWRCAVRERGEGWASRDAGERVLHYTAEPPPSGWLARGKLALGRALGRELHVSCVVRSEPALASAVREIRRFAPQRIVADGDGAAALARHVNQHHVRGWRDIPVAIAADRLWPHDRSQIEAAFGPVFEAYTCRDLRFASECEAHDGLHVAMETAIVEIVVRGKDGSARPARPGEVGEVAITDLHNLACPMIRYLTGDLAIARRDTRCRCGRGLATITPIHGRVASQYVDEIAVGSAGARRHGAAAPAVARGAMLA